METRILDGKEIGRRIREEVGREIEEKKLSPGLTVVLVGDDPASKVYVKSKTKACQELGIRGERVLLDESISTAQLLQVINRLNLDDQVDGILVQLPLPRHIDKKLVLEAVDPSKDVDGFHPVNVGRLCTGDFTLAPCTPMGIMEMLRMEKIAVKGAHAVIVGRSDIVGKPMAMLLLHSHATITICHSRTRDLAQVCRRADILVAAVGRTALVGRDFIKEGATVIDVGMNRIEDREEAMQLFGEDSERFKRFQDKGYALVGDVHPREPLGRAGALTPVPGGVGPLTIAHLVKNTLLAHEARHC
ncbi:MAG TPA: bifunctional 5,10-methylenetetrahydrofolate dehydrogenase/5,10-methenyltetrahydrofolate cyclohydrolase [Acidobacteriota bacterium]|nr:bifunctional 5,10-methylenetetrahydrofolate dehydrogenase/5,10-methenyltetrahydrofolate cyclohydrolase [Acidobacteriota bacterium]